MIFSSRYEVKLPIVIRKILYLHAAYNETFVFLCLIVDRKDAIIHVDKEGKILFKHLFDKPMDTMAMMSDKQVILVETRKNYISVLDLTTHTFRNLSFSFMNEESDQSLLRTFSETKYVCLEEKGRYNDNRFKLTYFPYPLQLNEKKTAKHCQIYESKDNEWTYQHKTVQANNYSMVLWFKPRHDDSFQFKTYDIQQGKGQFRHYRFPHSIAATEHHYKLEAFIYNAWELKANNFIFLCWTADTGSKEGTRINSNYVIDVQKEGAIREAKFNFGPFQDYLTDCYNLGTYSMFRTFKIQQNKALASPTYYIDNLTETLMGEEPWVDSSLHKYEFEGYSTGTLCQGLYQNLDVSKFQVIIKRVINRNILYTFLLQEYIGKNIDGDLINDVLSVLA